MSLLKQTALAQVAKNETVLNSYDSTDSGATEGFVYECRWSAIEYVPSTASGFDISAGDLVRFTTVDDLGADHTSILLAQASFNLIKNGDISEIDVTKLNTAELEAFDADGLYKKTNKYFKRKYQLYFGNANDSSTADSYSDQNIVVADKALIPAILTSDVTAAAFLGGSSPDALDFTFAGTGGHRRFTAPYFGKISATSVVPNGAWFYYAGDDIGAGIANAAAGYYLNSTGGTVDFSQSATFTNAIFADQNAVVGGGLASYVWALGTGSTQVTLSNSTGFPLESIEVADLLDAGQISNLADPSATNEYWEEIAALATPLQFSAGVASETDPLAFVITTANELTDNAYWNLLSENFIEDYDQSVGSAGVQGADPAGVYASSYVASTASATVRAQEITAFTSAQATTDAVVTVPNHGYSDGDTIVISNLDVAYDGSHTIDVVSENQFRLDSTSGQPVIAYTGGAFSTENGASDLVWKETFPPTTDQTLLYRY